MAPPVTKRRRTGAPPAAPADPQPTGASPPPGTTNASVRIKTFENVFDHNADFTDLEFLYYLGDHAARSARDTIMESWIGIALVEHEGNQKQVWAVYARNGDTLKRPEVGEDQLLMLGTNFAQA